MYILGNNICFEKQSRKSVRVCIGVYVCVRIRIEEERAKKKKKKKSKSSQNLFISLLKTRIRIPNKMANRNIPDQSNELSSTKEEKLKVGNRPKYQLKISIPLDKLSGYIPRNPTTSNRDEDNRNELKSSSSSKKKQK